MEFLGDVAEFKRGRGPDKRPRKRRREVGIAAATIGGGGVLGVGATGLVRRKAYQDFANPRVAQISDEYRSKTGKPLKGKKLRATKKIMREGFRNEVREIKTNQAWREADNIFNYEVGKRRPTLPNLPWRKGKGRIEVPKGVVNKAKHTRLGQMLGLENSKHLISGAPVRVPIGRSLRNAAVIRPVRTGGAIGLAGGALAYGGYRAVKAINNRRR